MRLPLDALLLAQRSAGQVNDTKLFLPTSEPKYAQPLDPQLGAFSIEMDNWRDWAGETVGAPNSFVNSALSQISKRTGHPVFLRVGANSEDRATLDLNVEVMNATFPAPTPEVPAPEAETIQIGRDFYALSGNLPEGTNFHWGVNLKVLNDDETVSQLTHLRDSFARPELANVHLKAVELGNEADFYAGMAGRNPVPKAGWEGWNPANYTQTWVRVAKAALGVFDFGKDKDLTLSPGSFANVLYISGLGWPATSIFQQGLLDDPEVKDATHQFTMHAYSGAFSTEIPVHVGTLMSKYNVRANLTLKAPDIHATQAEGLTYVLSEGNSYANHGIPGLSNGGEETIWAVDHLLQLASLGVRRMHFHNGRGFKYNVLQPIGLEGTGVDDETGLNGPHVMALYHALLIVAEAAGTAGAHAVKVVEIPTTTDFLAAYGIYEGGRLARLVLINSQVHTADNGDARAGLRVHLDGVRGTARRFHTPHTDATRGFTWAGQSFETPTAEPSGEVVDDAVDGVVELEASSVVLVNIEG